jgi:hypothetical protein
MIRSALARQLRDHGAHQILGSTVYPGFGWLLPAERAMGKLLQETAACG